MENRDPLTEKIIACCYKVHSELGPGLNEKIYHNALKIVLNKSKLNFDTEKRYEVSFQGEKVGTLIIDLIIENKVIVEIKAVTGIMPIIFQYQLLSYLKVSGLHVGLLVNFGNKSCQIKRLMN